MCGPLALLALLIAAPALAQTDDPAAAEEMVRLVNQERQSRGLATLVVDQKLVQAARRHSQLMASTGELEHVIGNEARLPQRITGLRFDASGENVALSSSPARAHDGLMHSPGHRSNILDPQYNAVGIAVIRADQGLYITEDFAHKLREFSVDEAESEIAVSLNRLRQSAGMPQLNRHPAPELRARACEMAANDRVDPHAGLISSEVRDAIAFTALDFAHVPDSLHRLKNAPVNKFSIGACYRSSGSYPNPVFWVLVVTYQ